MTMNDAMPGHDAWPHGDRGSIGRPDLVLRSATLADGTRADIAIEDGRIARIAPEIDPIDAPGAVIEDARGQLALPSFTDLHMHLDKAFTLESTENSSGTLEEAIARYEELRPTLTREGFVERALRTLRLCLAAGTTRVRTHVNVYPAADGSGLMPVEAALEARARARDVMDVQIVLLPAGNLAHDRGLYEACEEALRLGADAVGGAPALDPDPDAAIASAFALAQRFDRPVDLHVDESDDPGVRTLATVAAIALQTGYGGRVTAGHCCSLAAMDDDSAARLIERVAEARITVVTLPSCNLYLQGRHDRQPIRRGLTRVKELAAAGVNVAAASDNIRDPFNPFGRGDLLHIADLLVHAVQLGSPAEQRFARDAIGANPRAAFGAGDPTPWRGGMPRQGDRADLVVCAVSSAADLIAVQPARSLVLHGGRVVVRTSGTTDTLL